MKPEDMLLQAWKLQLDAGLRAAEALYEGAIRMHECSGNLQQCLEYWSTMQQNAVQTNTEMAKAERAAV